MPALAADEPVTLDQTKLSLSPKQSVVLHATRSSEYQDQRITWKSSDTSVATLSDQDHKKGNVTITAKKKGTTAITASVGGYLAVCNVTVEDDYVTDVTITPAGPETLPVGKTRQLEAEVVYAHGTQGDQTVTWTTDNPKVATVTQKGLVTAVSEGTAEIVALSKEGSKNGTPVMETYQLTVTKQGASSADDVLSLSATTVTTSGGQYVDTVLKAPVVTIRSGATDVTDAYTLSYRWTDSAQKELGTQDTQLIQPVTLSDLTVTCTVTATSKTDSTQVLTGSCRYAVKVYPGTTVGAAHALTKGSVTLDKLMDLEGKQSILDQLLQGDGDSLLTPAIPGLTHVVFDMNSVTGAAAGTLSARGEVEYYLSRRPTGITWPTCPSPPSRRGPMGSTSWPMGTRSTTAAWKWWSADRPWNPLTGRISHVTAPAIPSPARTSSTAGTLTRWLRCSLASPPPASCCGTWPMAAGWLRRAPATTPTPPATASTMSPP